MTDLIDLAQALTDCLDDLATLRLHNADRVRQEQLRLQAGSLVLQMEEQFDPMDYEYALLLCEIKSEEAEQYKRTYVASVRGQMEAQVNG